MIDTRPIIQNDTFLYFHIADDATTYKVILDVKTKKGKFIIGPIINCSFPISVDEWKNYVGFVPEHTFKVVDDLLKKE